jgi:C4-dicarboxylate-specific signal transduction histidine kinase
MLPANLIDLRGLVLSSKRAKEGTMIDTRHFGAAPNDTEKEFAAQIRTQALTLASEALSEAQVDPAHVDRITTMGRLTASAANEMTQPIATIVTNAQAARHFLDHLPPDLDEVREALDCIVRDAYRAGDVIDGIRALFKEVPPKNERVEIKPRTTKFTLLTRNA